MQRLREDCGWHTGIDILTLTSMLCGEEELRAIGRSRATRVPGERKPDVLPRRKEVRNGVCIWCSLLPVHTQQLAYCHALQHTSLPILYAYVTINASTILLHIFKWTLCSIFSSGRGVARGLSSIPGIASIIKALHPDNTCHFILGISVVYT